MDLDEQDEFEQLFRSDESETEGNGLETEGKGLKEGNGLGMEGKGLKEGNGLKENGLEGNGLKENGFEGKNSERGNTSHASGKDGDVIMADATRPSHGIHTATYLDPPLSRPAMPPTTRQTGHTATALPPKRPTTRISFSLAGARPRTPYAPPRPPLLPPPGTASRPRPQAAPKASTPAERLGHILTHHARTAEAALLRQRKTPAFHHAAAEAGDDDDASMVPVVTLLCQHASLLHPPRSPPTAPVPVAPRTMQRPKTPTAVGSHPPPPSGQQQTLAHALGHPAKTHAWMHGVTPAHPTASHDRPARTLSSDPAPAAAMPTATTLRDLLATAARTPSAPHATLDDPLALAPPTPLDRLVAAGRLRPALTLHLHPHSLRVADQGLDLPLAHPAVQRFLHAVVNEGVIPAVLADALAPQPTGTPGTPATGTLGKPPTDTLGKPPTDTPASGHSDSASSPAATSPYYDGCLVVRWVEAQGAGRRPTTTHLLLRPTAATHHADLTRHLAATGPRALAARHGVAHALTALDAALLAATRGPASDALDLAPSPVVGRWVQGVRQALAATGQAVCRVHVDRRAAPCRALGVRRLTRATPAPTSASDTDDDDGAGAGGQRLQPPMLFMARSVRWQRRRRRRQTRRARAFTPALVDPLLAPARPPTPTPDAPAAAGDWLATLRRVRRRLVACRTSTPLMPFYTCHPAVLPPSVAGHVCVLRVLRFACQTGTATDAHADAHADATPTLYYTFVVYVNTGLGAVPPDAVPLEVVVRIGSAPDTHDAGYLVRMPFQDVLLVEKFVQQFRETVSLQYPPACIRTLLDHTHTPFLQQLTAARARVSLPPPHPAPYASPRGRLHHSSSVQAIMDAPRVAAPPPPTATHDAPTATAARKGKPTAKASTASSPVPVPSPTYPPGAPGNATHTLHLLNSLMAAQQPPHAAAAPTAAAAAAAPPHTTILVNNHPLQLPPTMGPNQAYHLLRQRMQRATRERLTQLTQQQHMQRVLGQRPAAGGVASTSPAMTGAPGVVPAPTPGVVQTAAPGVVQTATPGVVQPALMNQNNLLFMQQYQFALALQQQQRQQQQAFATMMAAAGTAPAPGVGGPFPPPPGVSPMLRGPPGMGLSPAVALPVASLPPATTSVAVSSVSVTPKGAPSPQPPTPQG